MKKGDLLIPKSDTAKSTWGKGIIIEAEMLTGPIAHYAFWFSHGREIIIEEEVVLEHFDVIESDEPSSSSEVNK